MTPQEERDAALIAYKSARDEFAAAQEQWDPFLVTTDKAETEINSIAADAAFDRLRRANQASQDALDSLWLAWRNRPDPA